MNDECIMNTEFIDDEYQTNDDFNFAEGEDYSDYTDEFDENDSDERKLNKSRFLTNEGKYRFFRQECEKKYEFNRVSIKFHKDDSDYQGIVLKELDKTHFIFLVEDSDSPSKKKMKKIDINDISVYF